MPTTAWCGGTWPTSRTCRRTTLQDSSGQDRESNPPVKKQRPGRQPGSCGGGWTIEGRASLSPSRSTLQRLSGQSRKPRNQAEFRSVYIADLQQVAETNGLTLSDVPPLPIRSPKSRVGRKSLQKTFDADCRRLRREAGAPARTGPPIPGSEHNGHRRFYTLEQCRHGGRLSGKARRDQAKPRWVHIQTLHYRGHSLRAISRQVGLSLSQVHRVVANRLWQEDGEAKRSSYRVMGNSLRGTPRQWARALALNEVYRSRCWSADKLLHRLTVRREAYIEGIVKNRGPDYAAAVVAATERYVISLADLDVATAVRRVNQDSGYRPAGAVAAYRESTSWQRTA